MLGRRGLGNVVLLGHGFGVGMVHVPWRRLREPHDVQIPDNFRVHNTTTASKALSERTEDDSSGSIGLHHILGMRHS